MNITEMLGLQDERMASVVKEYWAGWVAFEPRLGVVDDPAGLDAGVDGYIAERLGASPDHPMTIEFPEGEYLKGLVVVRKPL